MQRYRFTDFNNGHKWYLMRPTHLDAPAEFCLDLPSAGLFTEAEWLAWGSGSYEREEAATQPAAGLVRLPGMEE